jgi:hypothetical protein
MVTGGCKSTRDRKNQLEIHKAAKIAAKTIDP